MSAACAQEQMSPQEATVRAAYASMVPGSRLHLMANSRDWAPGEPELSIRIDDVRTGPVSDILDDRLSSRVTVPSGDVLTTMPAGWDFEQTHMATGVQVEDWRPADQIHGDFVHRENWAWTFRQIIQANAWRASSYADYTVALSARGRERVYKAMFLFEGNGSSTVTPIDYILANSTLQTVMRSVGGDIRELPARIESGWTASLKRSRPDSADRNVEFAKHRSAGAARLLDSAQAAKNCVSDQITGLCCDPASGRCGIPR